MRVIKFKSDYNSMYKLLRFIFGPKKIGTHDGRFHCDEIMACTMLKNYVRKYE